MKTALTMTVRPGVTGPNLSRLRKRLAPIFAALSEPEGELSVLFTGDAEMKRLNRRFRGKNKTTDVLSFPAGDAPGPAMLGDVVVSVPVALRQARQTGWSFEKECFFLLLHGILHLMGYDHERSAKEAHVMADLQHKLMNIGYARKTKGR